MAEKFSKYQLAIDILRERIEVLGGSLFTEAFLKERIEITKTESPSLGFLFEVIAGSASELPAEKLRDFQALSDVLIELAVMRDAEKDEE
jgi:hypothetical protein